MSTAAAPLLQKSFTADLESWFGRGVCPLHTAPATLHAVGVTESEFG